MEDGVVKHLLFSSYPVARRVDAHHVYRSMACALIILIWKSTQVVKEAPLLRE